MPTKKTNTKSTVKQPVAAKAPAIAAPAKPAPKTAAKPKPILNTPAKAIFKPAPIIKSQTITPPPIKSINPLPAKKIPGPTCCRNGKKTYPLIGIALIAMCITLGALLWSLNDSCKKFDKFAQTQVIEKVAKASDILVMPKLDIDYPLVEGAYYISGQPWSPDGKKIYLTKNGPDMEIGLPEYITYDIFDLTTNTTTVTGIKNGLDQQPPAWQDNDYLLTENNIYDLTDSAKIISKDRKTELPAGFELLDKVVYTNPIDKTSQKDVYNLAVSPDGQWAAFLSRWGSETLFPNYETRLFIMPKNAKSLEEMMVFGAVASGAENISLPLFWSKNSQYLVSGQNEIFDVRNNKIILAHQTDTYRRRLAYLSPDQTQALVISNFQDKVEQNDYLHEQVKVYFLDLASGKEIPVVSFESADENLTDIDADYSIDGRYIVFNHGGQIWLAETKTGKSKPLTIDKKSYHSPRFSPDLTKIIYFLPGRGISLIKLSW